MKPDFDPGANLQSKPDGWFFTFSTDTAWKNDIKRKVVTTELLGRAKVANLPYENADGSVLGVRTDYFGGPRDDTNPFPGPIEVSQRGRLTVKVWPKPTH
jgi:alpha-N-arabinofuranosidase